MLEFDGLLTEHPFVCSVVAIVIGVFYHHISELIELQKLQRQQDEYIVGNQRNKMSRKGSFTLSSNSFQQPEEVTVSSTFSSTLSSRDLQAKLAACERVIQSLQNELQTTKCDNSKLRASLGTAHNKAAILEQEGTDMKELLEKEQTKVLNLQSKQIPTPTQMYELEWDKADAMISLVNVQKEIYELESSISMHRFELVQKQNLLEVEMQRVSLEEVLGAREHSEAFLQAEQEKLRSIHDGLEESIARIEANQERLLSEQFSSHDELAASQKQEQVLLTKIEEKEGAIAIQKQQMAQLERLVEMEKEKARNQVEGCKIKYESAERKLENIMQESVYNQKRVDDLEQMLKAETKRSEESKGDSHKNEVILRTKDTQIEALKSSVAALKEKEEEQQVVVEKLRKLHEQERERVDQMKIQAEKLAKEKLMCEDALEKVNMKMEAKLEAIMKQKHVLKQFEEAQAQEQQKSAKINEQLPQLYNLIKVEETKGTKLKEELDQKNGQLLKEKLKVQQLQKELSNMSALLMTQQKDDKATAEAIATAGGDRKAWFWKQQS
ncbi:unnamed protein product [Cylindrotheca closterium]|uniref:Uncharacterized protein n=1 Tax=Cylindrotheca closterium TaxID=2856 RepID=A0AAD2FZB0_9STRA|nr:unnamed protein product [Cylindrotheca closterium]